MIRPSSRWRLLQSAPRLSNKAPPCRESCGPPRRAKPLALHLLLFCDLSPFALESVRERCEANACHQEGRAKKKPAPKAQLRGGPAGCKTEGDHSGAQGIGWGNKAFVSGNCGAKDGAALPCRIDAQGKGATRRSAWRRGKRLH